MLFKNDAQRRAIFASLGGNFFSSNPSCLNSFATDKKKNIERLIKRLAPRISDEFDPQAFDFWAEYDDTLSFDQNSNIIAKKLEQIGAIKSNVKYDLSKEKENETDELMHTILMERGNIDFNSLITKLNSDKSLKNSFRNKLTTAVLTGIISEDNPVVSQFDAVDDTFHRRLSSIERIKASGVKSAIKQQLLDSEARQAALEAASSNVQKEDVKEQKLSDVIGEALEKEKEVPVQVQREVVREMPDPEEKDYIRKLVDATFTREDKDAIKSGSDITKVIPVDAKKVIGFGDNELDYIEWSDQM